MAAQQTPDHYAKRSKQLVSSVKQLRGWLGSDPSRLPEFAEALNALTEHRLFGHEYLEAAVDAQEAVTQCAKVTMAAGPIGPYTPMDDAARYFAAVTHVATIQVGLGLPAGAGVTMGQLDEWRRSLTKPGLAAELPPSAAVWALMAQARGALEEGRLGDANAYADAVTARLWESGYAEQDGFLSLFVDGERLVADARWAVGLSEQALHRSLSALYRYRRMSDQLLEAPQRLPKQRLARLLGPLLTLVRDVADRLVESERLEEGLTERARFIDVLEACGGALSDAGVAHLAQLRADQAHDLMNAGRLADAEASARQAGRSGGLTAAGVLARVLCRVERADEAQQVLGGALAGAADPVGPMQTAQQADALYALAEVQRARGDGESSEATQAVAERLALSVAGESRAWFGDVPLARLVRDRARGVVTRSLLPTPHWELLSDEESLAASTATPEEEAVAGPVAKPGPRPEPEPEAQPEPEPEAQPEPEPEAQPEPEPEAQPEPEPLVQLESAFEEAQASGDRGRTLAANEAWVQALRGPAEAEPDRYGPKLVAALRELATSKRRAGDWWGSRAPGREAKNLAKQLGLG